MRIRTIIIFCCRLRSQTDIWPGLHVPRTVWCIRCPVPSDSKAYSVTPACSLLQTLNFLAPTSTSSNHQVLSQSCLPTFKCSHNSQCSHKSKSPCVNPLVGDWIYSCERSVFHSATSEIIASVKWLNRFLWFIWYLIPSTWNDYICTFFCLWCFHYITLVYCSNKQWCILR